MAERLKNLLEKRATAWEQMLGIRARAEQESRDTLTAEEREQWDRIEAELTNYTADIEREQRANEFAKAIAPVLAEAEALTRGAASPDAEYRNAFLKWARGGTGELDADEKRALRQGFVSADNENRALGVGTGAAGGYAVPQGFRNIIVEAMKYFNAMRQVATVITTDTGATLPWPVNNDTANIGAILAENTVITQQDITLAQEQLAAYMYTSKLILVSYQLLQDSAIDLEAFLGRKMGQRVGRIQNQHFTTGTGTSQPTGLITGATNISTAATGSTTAIKYADLVNTMFKVDPAYRGGPNVKWMWSDTALATIRGLVDLQGRPLWEPSVQAGTPDMLLGKELIINNDLPVPSANAKTGAFGDFEAGYVIRDVKAIQTVRLDERYADALQVGWFAYLRSDGTVQDTSAYAVFQQSAT
jgi:HK97 family phage major capsid protein